MAPSKRIAAVVGAILSFVCVSGSRAAPHEIHVAPNGVDSGSGSDHEPLRSIAEAATRAGPGTIVMVAPGDYAGGFRTDASGTAEKPISFVSQTPGGARIVGSGPSAEPMGWSNQGSHVRISGFVIDGSGRGAVSWRFGFYSTGSDVTFQGNRVHHILTDEPAFDAASVSGMGGAGIEMDNWSGGRDTRIDHNLVYAIGPDRRNSSLVHGIYQIAIGTVSDNVIHDVAGCGITLWHGAGSIAIVNNTIDNARGGGIFVGSGDGGPVSPGVTAGDDVRVVRNIIIRSVRGITEHGRTGVHNVYVGNLLFDNTSWAVRLQHGLSDEATIRADPLFLDRDRHDYRLRAGSLAEGVGASGIGFGPH